MVETYMAVAISTAHLTQKDIDALGEAAADDGENMVMARKTGFFVKLYGHDQTSNLRHGHSQTIKDILRWAFGAGWNLVEFDRDADTVDIFPVFDSTHAAVGG